MENIIYEIIDNAKNYNIDSKIIKRLLKSSVLNNESNIYMLRKLFNGMNDKYILELFSILYDNNYVKLTDYSKIEKTLRLFKNTFYISYRKNVDFNEDKLCLIFDIINRFENDKEVQLLIIKNNLINLSLEELKLRKNIYLLLKSMDTISYKYVQAYLKGEYEVKNILENESITLKERSIYFTLIKNEKIFINERLCLEIYKRLYRLGYSSALYLSIALSKEIIRSNNLYFEFIMNINNESILKNILELLETESLTEKEIYILTNMNKNEKESYIKTILNNKKNKLITKLVKKNENKIIEGLYQGFMNETLTINEFESELSLIRTKN